MLFYTFKGDRRRVSGEGGQMEELKACLREYSLPQRAINGKNRLPKAAFDPTGWSRIW